MQPELQSDEIDLMALFFRLWQRKKLIALVTICCGVLALLLTFVMAPKWTTKAQIIAPKDFEMTTALKRLITYDTIIGKNYDKKELDLGQNLYDTFLSELRSRDNQVDFFKQSKLFKKLGQGKSEARQMAILRTLTTKQLTVEWPNEKKNITFPTISFTADDPKDAQQTLTDYLHYLNTQVMHVNDKDFQTTVQNTVNTLETRKQILEANLTDSQRIKLENLNRALMAAKQAGIQEYARIQSGSKGSIPIFSTSEADIKLTDDQLSNNGFMFLLGQKYLQAQINSIKDSDPTYPIEYYIFQWQLPQLQKLLTPQDSALTDQSFHYQSSPYLPLQKDNPSRALITLIGLLIGFMLACLYVLLRDAATAYQAANKGAVS